MISIQHPTHWHQQQQPYNRSFTSSHLTNVSIPLRKAYLRVPPHQGRHQDQVNSYRQTRNSPSVTMPRNSVRKPCTLKIFYDFWLFAWMCAFVCVEVCVCVCFSLCRCLPCLSGCCPGQATSAAHDVQRMSEYLSVYLSALSAVSVIVSMSV